MQFATIFKEANSTINQSKFSINYFTINFPRFVCQVSLGISISRYHRLTIKLGRFFKPLLHRVVASPTFPRFPRINEPRVWSFAGKPRQIWASKMSRWVYLTASGKVCRLLRWAFVHAFLFLNVATRTKCSSLLQFLFLRSLLRALHNLAQPVSDQWQQCNRRPNGRTREERFIGR